MKEAMLKFGVVNKLNFKMFAALNQARQGNTRYLYRYRCRHHFCADTSGIGIVTVSACMWSPIPIPVSFVIQSITNSKCWYVSCE